MGMRAYRVSVKEDLDCFQIAVVDVEQQLPGFDQGYKYIILMNHTQKAYPIRVGSMVAPRYIMEKFGITNEITNNGLTMALQSIPELNVKWFKPEELQAKGVECAPYGKLHVSDTCLQQVII